MKVKELIKQLKEYDSEFEVDICTMYDCGDKNCYIECKIKSIYIEKDNDKSYIEIYGEQ